MIGPSLPKWFFKRHSAGSMSWSGNPKRQSRHAQLSVMPLEDRVLRSVTVFTSPSAGPHDPAHPMGMIRGPDGAMWFEDNGKLGRITTSGQITEYSVSGFWEPDMTVGPDGNIWYGNGLTGARERFDIATGKVTDFPFPITPKLPTATSWADVPWFATSSARLYWLDADGSLNVLPPNISSGGDFIAGPDGNLWYANDPGGPYVGEIVKLMPDGTKTEFSLPTKIQPAAIMNPEISAGGLTVGPDGNIWFTVWTQNMIGRVTSDGDFTEFSLPPGTDPFAITSGPDGNLWFTGSGQIDRITTTGTVSQFLPNSNMGNPVAIVVGADGNLWFSDFNAIYRMTPDTLPTTTSQAIVTEEGYYSAPIATVSTVDPAAISAVVNWGNGEMSMGTLVNNGQGSYNVVAPTTFAQPGNYLVTISINDPQGGQSIIHTYVTVKPSRSANFLTAIYQDLLGRQPDSTGMTGWLSKLGQGATRTEVVLGIETSREYRLRLIDNLYTSILERHADGTGQAFFLQQLQSGATVEQIKSQIFGSVEYFQHSGGTYLGFLSSLYQHVLGRGVDAVGARAGSMALAAGATPAVVALEVLDSQEAANVVVTGMYEQFLERKPEPVALGQWKNLLKSGTTDETLLAGIAASDEFFAKF